jgi:hypothetical protein
MLDIAPKLGVGKEISPTTKPLPAGAAAELHPPHLFICIY